MKIKHLLVILITVILTMNSYAIKPNEDILNRAAMENMPPRMMMLIDSLEQSTPQVSIEDVKTKIDANDDFYLIDVRELDEWNKGRLPGAIFTTKGLIEYKIENIVPDPNAEIVIYCAAGYRSIISANNLIQMGYTNVASMKGGMNAWREAMYPVATDPKKTLMQRLFRK